MAKCNFSFDLPNGTDLLKQAKTAITGMGGEFNGDNTAGNFVLPTPIGTVKGNYTITGTLIELSITDKPLLIGCGKIEEKLKQYLLNS